MHPTSQKAIDYKKKIKRKFLLVEIIQQTDTVMSIDVTAANDPMKQQRLANIMF